MMKRERKMELSTKRHGKTKTKVLGAEVEHLDEPEDLLGDEKATVRRGRSFRLALSYGEVAITTSCDVTLTCNQTKKSIRHAALVAEDLIDEILQQDIREMPKLLERHRRSDED